MASVALRRALLYGMYLFRLTTLHAYHFLAVPASSERFLRKAASISAVDTLAYDLEDSVTLARKPDARAALTTVLRTQPRPPSAREVAVRINSFASGLADADLDALLVQGVRFDAVVLPKVGAADDLQRLTHRLERARERGLLGGSAAPAPRILALVESARAVVDLSSICRAAPPSLVGLIFAAEDFARDLGVTRTVGLREMLLARQSVVLAARAYSLTSIDCVCTTFRGSEGRERLESECADAKALGFGGKQCIHPEQVEPVQRMFAPSEKEVGEAVRILTANERAEREGRGAWTLDGKMIDAPVVGKARLTVERAEQCGIDPAGLREQWKDAEPE